MVSFDPESQIGPNPYAERSDEDFVTRWNGFERESAAMETELLKRGYLPLHEGLPNRKLVPGDKHELEAAHARGEHEFSLKDNKPIEGCSWCEEDWRNFDGSYWDAHDDAWATIVADPNHPTIIGEEQERQTRESQEPDVYAHPPERDSHIPMFDIPNEELRPEHVPGPDAPWHPTIAEFALTFDGYEAMGNRLSKYAERRFERWKKDGSLPRDLLHLRSCLFMEQRAVRWAFDERPTAEQLAYAHALIAAIRIPVKKGVSAEERQDQLD